MACTVRDNARTCTCDYFSCTLDMHLRRTAQSQESSGIYCIERDKMAHYLSSWWMQYSAKTQRPYKVRRLYSIKRQDFSDTGNIDLDVNFRSCLRIQWMAWRRLFFLVEYATEVSAIICQIVVLACTLAKTLDQLRNSRIVGLDAPLTTILAKYGTFYFW